MKLASIFGLFLAGLTGMAIIPSAHAADAAPADVPAPAAKLSPTVGVNITQVTRNPDKTYTLLFVSNNNGQQEQRKVILNDQTVISIDGKFSKIADINLDVLRMKVIATVADDMITAVLLKFGKPALEVSGDQLTPAQQAALKAVAPVATAASNAALDKRVAGIVGQLKLNDPAREARLTAVLKADLSEVRDAHNAGFAPAKSVHEALNAGLQADLTPDQVEAVKDALTGNQAKRDFSAYHQIVPGLNADDDKFIMDTLHQAREAALDIKDANQAKQTDSTFKPFKVKIQDYLTAHGHDWKALDSAFVKAEQAKTASPAAPAPVTAQ